MLAILGFQPARRQAEVITQDMEAELWQKQILGAENPHVLIRTAYFLVGKFFALRSREEHHALKCGVSAQVTIVGMKPNYYVQYTESSSKNNNGGIKHARYNPKSGRIYPTGGLNCPVAILQKFISLTPPKATKFYNRPNIEYSKRWFNNQPMGIHKLSAIMPDIAIAASWDTNLLWSGHSLRASAITQLYDEGYGETAVKMVSGHRSDFAVREYMRSEKLKRKVSATLSLPSIELESTSKNIRPSCSKDDSLESVEVTDKALCDLAGREDQITAMKEQMILNQPQNCTFNVYFK